MAITKISRSDLGAGTLRKIENQDFKNSVLEDVDGKEVAYVNCDFSYSIVVRGYFHKSRFENCKFIGTRFVDTNFRTATFELCQFSYSDFNRCLISVPQMLANLPTFANVRWELLHNIRANMRAIGDARHESDLVWQEIDTEIEHWRAIVRSQGGYYGKYSRKERWLARLRHSRLLAERYVWGHGESLFRLAGATMMALAILGVMNAVGGIGDLGGASINSMSKYWLNSFLFIGSLFIDLPNVNSQDVANSPVTSILAVLLRYVSIGLAVPILYKSIAKR